MRAVPKAWDAAAADPARPEGWVSRSMCSAMAASARSRHNAPGGSGSSPGRNSTAGTLRAVSPWARRSWSTLRRTHANRSASSLVKPSGVHRTVAGLAVARVGVRTAGRLGKWLGAPWVTSTGRERSRSQPSAMRAASRVGLRQACWTASSTAATAVG